MTKIFKHVAALAVVLATASSTGASAQFVHYQDVPQPSMGYSGIAPSSRSSSSYGGYSGGYNYTPAPQPQPQKQVQQVTMYKVGYNGNLTKTLGKIEISNSGVILVSVRNNGSWWSTRGIVYAIDERDPMYQYFNYQVRSADGTQYLF